MKIRPFSIQIPDATLTDLRRRLHATRWPASLSDESWADGASLLYLQRLSQYWLHDFDWRAQEARLNRLPQFIATIGEMEIHFVHQRGTGPSPLPLVLTHGWPGSFAEMEHIIPLLADPGAHGGDPDDAFHVVVPSLPGYGFSPAPSGPGVSSRAIAHLWHRLMQGLGYSRFAAQGGDIGAGVSMWLAQLFPDSLAGVHLNYIPASYRPTVGPASPPLTHAEQEYLARAASWAAEEGAYAALQSTKPQTLAYALSDSPVGLAAWIVEKFRSWSDCDGDIQRVFSLDTLLTDISLYWFSDSLSASLRLYKENRLRPLSFALDERVATPIGIALFRESCRCRRGRGLSAFSMSSAGLRCRREDTSLRLSNRSCWRGKSETSFDRFVSHRRDGMTPAGGTVAM